MVQPVRNTYRFKQSNRQGILDGSKVRNKQSVVLSNYAITTYHKGLTDKIENGIMKELNKWYDDLIWCPSQCYYYFAHEGNMFCIYLRWRHDDPWTAEIIKCGESDFDLNYKTCIWKYIEIPFFKDDELDKLKEYIMNRLNIIMALWPHYEEKISLKLEDLKMLPDDIRQQVQTMWLELWEQNIR